MLNSIAQRILWNKYAWEDWNWMANQAQRSGLGDIVHRYEPPQGAEWHRVRDSIRNLRAAIKEAGRPPWCWW